MGDFVKRPSDTATFTDIHLDSSEEGNASISYSGIKKQATLDQDGKGSFNISEMLGYLDPGKDGVSVATLIKQMGDSKSTTLTGTITDKSGNTNPIEIKVTAN